MLYNADTYKYLLDISFSGLVGVEMVEKKSSVDVGLIGSFKSKNN